MIGDLVVVALVLVVLMGVFAPYETLGWWAGWYGDTPGKVQPPTVPEGRAPARHYVVYLSGIGTTSPEAYSPFERAFLARLRAGLPGVEVVADVFPYASTNRALTGERVFAWFWRRLAGLKGKRLGAVAFLINIRNLWQVLVSSDDRFGPLYNYASAELVFGKLVAHGYPLGSGLPVTLIGYSGGGQIATGAGPLLKHALRAPVHVVSLGGVMGSSEGVLELDSLTHLYGDRDGTQRIGAVLFPQRWPLLAHSPWNRAVQSGLVRRVPMGPMKHTGRGGYLDADARLEGGESFLEHTVRVIAGVVERNDAAAARRAVAAPPA